MTSLLKSHTAEQKSSTAARSARGPEVEPLFSGPHLNHSGRAEPPKGKINMYSRSTARADHTKFSNFISQGAAISVLTIWPHYMPKTTPPHLILSQFCRAFGTTYLLYNHAPVLFVKLTTVYSAGVSEANLARPLALAYPCSSSLLSLQPSVPLPAF